ncbi:MAG: tyrosine-type recombinase/integrase, partial [Mycobacterium sp.]
GKADVRIPKHGGERVVYLPDELVAMLAEHLRVYGVRPGGWLFFSPGGELLTHDVIYHWWKRALAGAGVTGVTPHDLRHFYASGLIAAGCDVVTVQRALGHTSAATTLSTYAHLWPNAEDRTRTAAAGLMRSALPADSVRTSGE